MEAALIGGKNIKMYTVADQLWASIAEHSGVDMSFSITPIADEEDLKSFYAQFLLNDKFVGFNVALPWKNSFERIVDQNQFVAKNCTSINTIYKKEGIVISGNSDVYGLPIDYINNNPVNNALILGLGGAGKAIMYFLKEHMKVPNITGFDLYPIELDSRFNVLRNPGEILESRYDLIINATPLGKLHLNEPPQGFSLPLMPKMLEQIAVNNTLVVELNYFPYKTPLLEVADLVGIKTVPGLLFLVDQALKSFTWYTGQIINGEQRSSIVRAMRDYIEELELKLYKLNNY